ncbi:MAG: exodeoxyribonuclease VII small subunit [Chloroflexi bacterium]|nr:exodeoxyribonuclease VII small subunit [Chloroflexota bacterium]MYF79360.1 exodeoxyribonuclease VII small subunit [Chloroflexota bacterium]MYK61909.1 exodeoxyribonuclease VII small subunit [Chloroflexota bacterium]
MTDSDQSQPEPPASFEDAFTRLESVVRRLESGQMSLDQSTALFEEGMQLAKTCTELLNGAELKIQRLQQGLAEQLNLVSDE